MLSLIQGSKKHYRGPEIMNLIVAPFGSLGGKGLSVLIFLGVCEPWLLCLGVAQSAT